MTARSLLWLILAVGALTYALRAVPLALLRRPLREPHLVAFIGFLPYAILAAMIVPGVLDATGGHRPSALAGAAVALVLALLRRSLPVVAAGAAAAALLARAFLA